MSPGLSAGDPRAPKFWMYETSGVLRPAIEAYLHNRPMTVGQIALMRVYLRQWIMSPVWQGGGKRWSNSDPPSKSFGRSVTFGNGSRPRWMKGTTRYDAAPWPAHRRIEPATKG
ncbi:MAG: hypothetical protein WDO73_03055 [Ignavibacteriota bacterium]